LYIEWWINRLVSCSKALADEWPPLRSWGWGFLGQADKAPKTTLGWKWTHLYQPKRTTPQHHNDRWFCLIAAFAWLLYHIDVTTTTKTQISSLFRIPSLQTASTSIDDTIYLQSLPQHILSLLITHNVLPSTKPFCWDYYGTTITRFNVLVRLSVLYTHIIILKCTTTVFLYLSLLVFFVGSRNTTIYYYLCRTL
jgi:hypothetical protein